MKYKTTLSAVFLALSAVLCMCGCGSQTDSSLVTDSSTTASTDTTSSAAPENTTSATSAEPSSSVPETDIGSSSQVTEEVPAEAPWSPTIPQRQDIISSGSVMGVVYIGYVEYDADIADCRKIFADSEYSESFAELSTIPDENFVINEGTELYLFIPGSTEQKASVNRWDIDMENAENEFAEIIGEELFSTDCGAPFILKCNTSEIIANAMITITDSSGKKYQWRPSISLRDGTVAIYNEQMPVYDFTHYPFEVKHTNKKGALGFSAPQGFSKNFRFLRRGRGLPLPHFYGFLQ